MPSTLKSDTLKKISRYSKPSSDKN